MAGIRLFGVDIPVSSQSIRLFGVDIPVFFTLPPNAVSRNAAANSLVPVYNPVPLRSCPATREKSGRKRKRDGEKMTRPVKRRRGADDHDPAPTIPPELLQEIETTDEPVFLYQKKLEESDVLKGQNRLFVTRREGFDKFLDDGENAVLNDSTTKGLKEIVGVDSQGKSYNLGLNIWQSMNMLVINSGWSELVKENNAKQGDWVQIWGYREMGNLRLAINFNKAREPILRLGVEASSSISLSRC